MQLRTILLLVFLVIGLGLRIKSAQTGDETIFFLKDTVAQQWCAYSSETESKSQLRPIPPDIVGGVEYKEGRLATIHVSEVDETWDWRVSDEYTVNSGSVKGLKREITILPGDVHEEQIWAIEDGKVIRQNGSRSAKLPDVVIKIPVVTRLEAFPF